jgi:hypothetical protein
MGGCTGTGITPTGGIRGGRGAVTGAGGLAGCCVVGSGANGAAADTGIPGGGFTIEVVVGSGPETGAVLVATLTGGRGAVAGMVDGGGGGRAAAAAVVGVAI